MGYLFGVFVNKIVIIIMYWIYLLLEFDKILVFEDGWIVEFGIYEELIKLGGYYVEMVEN